MFADVLQELRKKARLTQDQIADILGVPKRTYGSWERNERQPDFEILCRIADYYKVSADYLLGRVPMPIEVIHSDPPPLQDGEVELVFEAEEKTPSADELERMITAVVMEELKKRGL